MLDRVCWVSCTISFSCAALIVNNITLKALFPIPVYNMHKTSISKYLPMLTLRFALAKNLYTKSWKKNLKNNKLWLVNWKKSQHAQLSSSSHSLWTHSGFYRDLSQPVIPWLCTLSFVNTALDLKPGFGIREFPIHVYIKPISTCTQQNTHHWPREEQHDNNCDSTALCFVRDKSS